MVELLDMPKDIQTELRNDPFIYVAANAKQINIGDLSAIVLKNDVMHVVDVLRRFDYKSGYHPFFLQHTDLFIQAQKLFCNLFGHNPDKTIYTYKKDFTNSFFLFTSSSLIEKALKNEEIEINIENQVIAEYYKGKVKKEEKSGIKITNFTISENKIGAKLPQGIFPVIGALNYFKAGDKSKDRTPNLNLIFGSGYDSYLDDTLTEKNFHNCEVDSTSNANEENWISNIDKYILQKFGRGISLYSIDCFDFLYNNEKFHDIYNPYSMEDFYSHCLITAQETFTKTIVNFLLAINRSAYLPLKTEEFSSFMPHFYGYDRIVGSVKHYDYGKKRRLKRLYDTSLEFAKNKQSLTCKHFIDYFLRDSITHLSKTF